MAALDWLTSRPVAHRGLHDAARGVIENTAGAVHAALDSDYGVEVDLQITADGEAMVYHDDELGRLTEGTAPLHTLTAQALRQVPFRATGDRMMSLGDLCGLVDGRVLLLLELKSRFDGDRRVAERTVDVLKDYRGPVAVMSFDPALIAAVRERAPHLTRGMVAQRHYAAEEWPMLNALERLSLSWFAHAPRSQPQFIAYAVRDLPATVPGIARRAFACPILTWTVRSVDDQRRAAQFADQIIFEGIRPIR
jgi:glycerophosphoryl diester phosphodiesterase